MSELQQNRRLAAILAADVVGYSRLMGQDESETVRVLTEYREVFKDHISRHRGTVVDTAGDSVLATFDSPVEAVQSAVEIQTELAQRNALLAEDRRMHFRIGINLGDVIAREDNTVYGDGVNIAARLESLAQPGGINVSSTVHDHVENKLPVAFEYTGEHTVKNIQKPVRAYRVLVEGAPEIQKPKVRGLRRWGAIAAVATIVLVAGGIAIWNGNRAPEPGDIGANTKASRDLLALPTGPSIAVLPFENMSGDPDQEYFSDGLTEDIITRLTRFPSFFVIARNSTYQYKGQAVDVRQVGRDLGAKYVVEGRVRKSGDSLRVTVQLVDSENGTHLWAETYDRDLTAANLFDIQDEITDRVTATIADARGIIVQAGTAASREKAAENLDAYECWLRLVSYYDFVTPDRHLEVRNCAERAVQSDPNYSRAWTTLAYTYTDESRFGFNTRPNALERALKAARRAVELDSDDALARRVLALVYFHQHDLDAFRAEAERAIALNPNNCNVLAGIGAHLTYTGEIERGSALVRKAATLNPNHPGWYHLSLSLVEYLQGNYDNALNHALKINLPTVFWTEVRLAMAFAELGRTADAQAAIDRLLTLYPDFAENFWEEHRRINMEDSLIRRSRDGLRKAGLDIPEESAASNAT